MNSADVIYTQCRFCLRLVDSSELFSIFSGDRPGPLCEFVQEMLSIELTADGSQICGDCFSMWIMMQDFLNACVQANKVLQTTNQVMIRKPWLENEDIKRMFIEVCRGVKKHVHEMQLLAASLEPGYVKPVVRKKTAGTKTKTQKRRRKNEHRSSEEPYTNDGQPVKNVSAQTLVKEEDPLEIDDSSAFVIEEILTEAGQSSTLESVQFSVIETEPVEPVLTDLLNTFSNSDGDESADDTVTIVEPEIDHIDLVDSSDEDQEDFSEHSSISSAQFDEEMLKIVCQICGLRTVNMAAHLETHITEPDYKSQSVYPADLESGLERPSVKQPPIDPRTDWLDCRQVTSLDCKVCGVQLASPLAAKIHARVHPSRKTQIAGSSPAKMNKQ